MKIPDDFPRFAVPGLEREMGLLRELYWIHYKPAGPLATLWDEWISGPTLWPALESTGAMQTIRDRWRNALSNRIIDPEGYVATHQHASIAHQLGWPFPFWKQSPGGTWGWHFSLHGVPEGWHSTKEKTQEEWKLRGGRDEGIGEHAWNIHLTEALATIDAPPFEVDAYQSPFIQLRWRATGLGNAQPYLEWTTPQATDFSDARRYYFAPIESKSVVYTMVPVFRHPQWSGKITGLRIGFGNRQAKGVVGIQSVFTQYDTRHNINNQNFVRGCCIYFNWTRDLNFLRTNIQRMRLAIHYLMTEMHTREEKCILTPFVGHCGRTGLERQPDGKKVLHGGRGIGNNYWDLLPMGHKDAYATMHYYDALQYMAVLERHITEHPEWNIPGGPLRFDPDDLLAHAREVKGFSGKLFWNPKTKRFTTGVDIDGKMHDYGYTFINLEAIHYDFATAEQARDIMSWIAGERTVEGDTSQGKDIYRWRFGPRATTKRNIDYYGWFWSGPETIPWGGQVQDGGAVLGFSYHDLMSRVKTRGPDDTWARLKEIVAWFGEVQQSGGYRAYYADGKRGTTLQGGGPPGGLGIDREFFESILVPQIMLEGFLGFQATPDGFAVTPRLPKGWTELRIDRIHLSDAILSIRATADTIAVVRDGPSDDAMFVQPPAGTWSVEIVDPTGTVRRTKQEVSADSHEARIEFTNDAAEIRLTR